MKLVGKLEDFTEGRPFAFFTIDHSYDHWVDFFTNDDHKRKFREMVYSLCEEGGKLFHRKKSWEAKGLFDADSMYVEIMVPFDMRENYAMLRISFHRDYMAVYSSFNHGYKGRDNWRVYRIKDMVDSMTPKEIAMLVLVHSMMTLKDHAQNFSTKMKLTRYAGHCILNKQERLYEEQEARHAD